MILFILMKIFCATSIDDWVIHMIHTIYTDSTGIFNFFKEKKNFSTKVTYYYNIQLYVKIKYLLIRIYILMYGRYYFTHFV